MVQLNGAPVVLHGFGTTCTEYLLRGIGMDCNVVYNWADPAAVLQVGTRELGGWNRAYLNAILRR